MSALFDLRECRNNSCKKCNPEERKESSEEYLCSITKSQLDTYPIRCVGPWAYKKIHTLISYQNIFAKGMKNQFKLNYIEICSGPGRCVCRNDGSEIDGSSLAVLNHTTFEHINKAIFIDYKEKVVETLNKRITKLGKSERAIAKLGDYRDLNSIISNLKLLSSKSLNLIFVDPTDCSVPFSLIKSIKKVLPRSDFIINVASDTDLKRNIRSAISNPSYKKAKAKYAEFLGSTEFFCKPETICAAKSGNDAELKRLFISEYENNLIKIGLKYFDHSVSIEGFYILLFASNNRLGLDFWKKSIRTDPDGQIKMNF